MSRPAPTRRPAVDRRSTLAPALMAALLSTTAATPLWAELSAEGVWQGWQAQATRAGQTLTAEDTARDGDTFTARGVTLQGEGVTADLSVRIDEIALTEADDGSVAVRLSDAYELRVDANTGAVMRVGVAHPGLRLSVSEDAGALRHDLSAPEITVTLLELSGEDTPDEAAMALSALRVAGHYVVGSDPLAATDAEIDAGALDLTLALRDGTDAVDLDYAATGLAARFAGAGLDRGGAEGMGAMAEALAAGFAVDMALDHDTQRFAMTSVEDGETAAVSGRSMEGRARFALDADALSVHSASRNAEITLPAEALTQSLGAPGMNAPEAMTLRAAEMSYGLSLPTSGAPEPQDASALVRFVDVTAPEEVWALADPSGSLQRAPVTAILDLGAGIVLPDDLFGMGTMMGFMMGGVFEAIQPTALDVREMALRFAGAELTGVGAFALDPADLRTIPGVPRPQGTLDLTLRGGEMLIDALVEAGLLPPDQANAARLTLAVLGQPGEAPGELVSTIEVDAQGAVRANGMRLR